VARPSGIEHWFWLLLGLLGLLEGALRLKGGARTQVSEAAAA
jgi:hypothetical protein